ncbi:M61 family metallopeptidase [Ignavibacteria bacterium CHB1]|jgi:predicted metalloprotease with PDZ domain|nr:MAG: M61 family peptidase [Chlorobiota bacterium]KXK02529.1 MAG: M61 glycyl aminopeptidase [Chlorobi bacterium OLB4]MBV6398123.1 hypothetical protein [Ignavibacteria bacterium]MCC6886572.1 M61 family metallopeptidase [Ignavibacteriales bacterium]MCE7952353.1 M61 family peptidase [Chlorobi bacterium CHB7]MDL1886470.1 M61 family metallopeptidase [Ignavibacteria bacterium CHB1]OQY77429.1 MAG: hypothetical protein B6D43_07390 [Ignavibacteriales bacterium UTCHB1]RIK48065.1 MAG: hypothetical pr
MEKISYKLSIEKPSTHYCNVELRFRSEHTTDKISLPVWTPGSYLIREFARFVSNVSCRDENNDLVSIQKVNKNTWQINGQPGERIVSYRVYCNETTVRSSVINNKRAFLNGSNFFMRVENKEHLEHEVEFKVPDAWRNISTGLYQRSQFIFYHKNYDDFIDCPVEIGNQIIESFEVNGIKHTISIHGKGNYDPKRLQGEFKSIVETQSNFFGGIPYDFYTFLIDFQESGYGGLEHKNSFAAIFPSWDFNDPEAYRKFLGLISHEYFHLWNVKRIRPVELGPFDYDKENYTESHWITEGWTSFYDNLFLYRSGLINESEYYSLIKREVNEVLHYSGRFEMSLAESSFDNWIKFYRKHENTRNEQISYYTKGALVAMLLNLEIIKLTDCKHSLDDVLLCLWKDYKENPETGYTQSRVRDLCESICGKSFETFWQDFIYGTKDIPIDQYFELSGLKLVDTNSGKISLDVAYSSNHEGVYLNEVYKGGTAYDSGLQSGDEIIAINNIRVSRNQLDKILGSFKYGDEIEVMINRGGYIETQSVKLIPALPNYNIELIEEISEQQKAFRDKWLNG